MNASIMLNLIHENWGKLGRYPHISSFRQNNLEEAEVNQRVIIYTFYNLCHSSKLRNIICEFAGGELCQKLARKYGLAVNIQDAPAVEDVRSPVPCVMKIKFGPKPPE
jgi:hypothetical protein